jgi:plastocyanin
MTKALAAALVLVAVSAAASTASAAVPVNIQFQAFAPSSLDVLPGETVEWTNISERPHTVTADDESFDSDEVDGGDSFAVTFDSVGAYGYHCRLHAGMVGEVDVRRVTLEALPIGLVQVGEHVEAEGRTADPSVPVEIERSIKGGAFETVATATPSADGTWKADLVAEKTAEYRARTGSDVSETRQLLVSDRRVIVIVRRDRVFARVVPPNPYQRVMLELKLPERFGWWPQQFKRFDYLSRASFRVHRRVRARVSLLDKDGWTRLAISRVVRVRPNARG